MQCTQAPVLLLLLLLRGRQWCHGSPLLPVSRWVLCVMASCRAPDIGEHQYCLR